MFIERGICFVLRLESGDEENKNSICITIF